jgi:hypothetical protein
MVEVRIMKIVRIIKIEIIKCVKLIIREGVDKQINRSWGKDNY